MIDTHCKKLKYRRMICLITNGTGEMQLRKIKELVSRVKGSNIVLRVLMIGMKDTKKSDLTRFESEYRNANIETFENIGRDYFSSGEGGEINDQYVFAPFEEAIYFLGKPIVQPVRITRYFNGNLYIGKAEEDRGDEDEDRKKKRIKLENTLTIPLFGYGCVKKAQPPSAGLIIIESTEDEEKRLKVSTNRDYYVEQANEGEAGEVKSETKDEPGLSEKEYVESESLSKGYKYGSEIVTLTEDTQALLSTISDGNRVPGLYVYSVCAAQDIPRWYAMSGSDYMISPVDAGERDKLAFSSLVLTLQLNGRVLIAKYINRPGYESKMVVLTPYVDVDFQALILNEIPFAEDHRHYQFPSLFEIKSKSGKPLPKDSAQRQKLEPTSEMNELMGQYIDNLNLDQYGRDEDGDPCQYMELEDVYHPHLHRLKHLIKLAAVTGENDLEIPPIWPSLVKYSHPPADLMDKSKAVVAKLEQLFEIKPVEKRTTLKQQARSAEEKSRRGVTMTAEQLESLFSAGPDYEDSE